MTAQTLLDQVNDQIESLLDELEAMTKKNHLFMRQEILAAARDLWDQAAVSPEKVPAVGNVVFVSKNEAYKYNRMQKLSELVKAQATLAANKDISNLEMIGTKIYTTEMNGTTWAYSQAYGTPVYGTAKVRMVAKALYSDFYGATFDKTIRKNLGASAQRILDTVNRGLNQGQSYTKIAKELTGVIDRSYSDAVRIARTEGGRIQSQANYDNEQLLDDAGIDYKKMWVSTIDSRTREDHRSMDGKYADDDGVFHLPSGATGQEPRMTGNASDDINCRCTSVNIINGEVPKSRRIRGEGIVPYETFTQRLERGGDIPVSEVRKAKK